MFNQVKDPGRKGNKMGPSAHEPECTRIAGWFGKKKGKERVEDKHPDPEIEGDPALPKNTGKKGDVLQASKLTKPVNFAANGTHSYRNSEYQYPPFG